MTADYAARVRTLAARHNREWQLLVEDMDRERMHILKTDRPLDATERAAMQAAWDRLHELRQHAEAEEHA